MRRTLVALALICSLGLPFASLSSVRAADAVGPVAFTVHAAYCLIDTVNQPETDLYAACHANAIGGIAFTFSGLGIEPVEFLTDSDGVGSIDILDGTASVTQVTLAIDPNALPVGGYAYCADQVDDSVLFDGPVINNGLIPLFTVDARQQIVCDWYIYSEEIPAG